MKPQYRSPFTLLWFTLYRHLFSRWGTSRFVIVLSLFTLILLTVVLLKQRGEVTQKKESVSVTLHAGSNHLSKLSDELQRFLGRYESVDGRLYTVPLTGNLLQIKQLLKDSEGHGDLSARFNRNPGKRFILYSTISRDGLKKVSEALVKEVNSHSEKVLAVPLGLTIDDEVITQQSYVRSVENFRAQAVDVYFLDGDFENTILPRIENFFEKSPEHRSVNLVQFNNQQTSLMPRTNKLTVVFSVFLSFLPLIILRKKRELLCLLSILLMMSLVVASAQTLLFEGDYAPNYYSLLSGLFLNVSFVLLYCLTLKTARVQSFRRGKRILVERCLLPALTVLVLMTFAVGLMSTLPGVSFVSTLRILQLSSIYAAVSVFCLPFVMDYIRVCGLNSNSLQKDVPHWSTLEFVMKRTVLQTRHNAFLLMAALAPAILIYISMSISMPVRTTDLDGTQEVLISSTPAVPVSMESLGEGPPVQTDHFHRQEALLLKVENPLRYLTLGHVYSSQLGGASADEEEAFLPPNLVNMASGFMHHVEARSSVVGSYGYVYTPVLYSILLLLLASVSVYLYWRTGRESLSDIMCIWLQVLSLLIILSLLLQIVFIESGMPLHIMILAFCSSLYISFRSRFLFHLHYARKDYLYRSILRHLEGLRPELLAVAFLLAYYSAWTALLVEGFNQALVALLVAPILVYLTPLVLASILHLFTRENYEAPEKSEALDSEPEDQESLLNEIQEMARKN